MSQRILVQEFATELRPEEIENIKNSSSWDET
jgi:hypothetical protein